LQHRTYCLAVAVILLSLDVSARAQNNSPPPQDDDVVRVRTDLVQTGVMVFDKQGHFVDGLQREQFELAVDGVRQPVTFFGQVKSGTTDEEAKLTEVRGVTTNSSVPKPPPTALVEEARRIIFFIDDLHLSLGSVGRTRQMLTRFLDHDMRPNDLVAIASTSGQIGFLQQFTEEKTVLRAAIGRLNYRPYNVRDMSRESTPMTEYMALTIERRDDSGVFRFYVDECLKYAPPRYTRSACEVEVNNRARQLLLQASAVTRSTYESLQNLMNSSAELRGRKIVFFVSDGFLLDTGPRNADPRGKLYQIIDAAQRSGVVVYTIDARGLVTNELDATNNVPFDPQGRLESASLREIPASQDAMHALASDTGGRALRNQNVFSPWINQILEESSNYYLLAWRPNNEEQATAEFHSVKVTVVGRPDLTVRLPRGFLRKSIANAALPAKPQEPKTPPQELGQALSAIYPKRDVQTSLFLNFLDTPEHGLVLTASVQVADAGLSFEAAKDKQTAVVDVAGVVVNDLGKQTSSFQTRLNITSGSNDPGSLRSTIYNYRVPLAPGLYQVRVAARDRESGRIGGATQWIEIPDLTSRRLTLSSLLLAQDAKRSGGPGENAGMAESEFSVDHRFSRNALLRFVVFIYNLGSNGKSDAHPSSVVRQIDLARQADAIVEAQILRGDQPVFTSSARKVTVAGDDPARIPYETEIPLNSLSPGRYVLQVTVTDRANHATAQRRTNLIIK
jgi:VWFA-related protein